MHILFTPALSDSLHISVPVNDTPDILVRFSASLGVTDYDTLKQVGATVQLWSDIPSNDANALSGDWHSFNLEEITVPGTDHPQDSMYIGDISTSHAATLDHVFLFLRLLVPVPSSGHPQFSYTYRLVYPSGEITWFGQFGRNGTLLMERVTADPALVLAAGWVLANDGYYMWNGESQVAVVRLAKAAQYDVWTLGRDSANLAFLVPRPELHHVYIPPIYILCASPDAAIDILPAGIVNVSGTGSLILKQLPNRRSELDSLANKITNHCASECLLAAVVGKDVGHLLVATKGRYPVQGTIVCNPCTIYHTHRRLSIPINTLSTLLHSRTTQISLFSPCNKTVNFIPIQSRSATFSFSDTSAGGTFILSPVIDLPAEGCHVSILTPYNTTQLIQNDPGILPTPPPSPELWPSTVPEFGRSPRLQDSENRDTELIKYSPTTTEKQRQVIVRRVPVSEAPVLLVQLGHILSVAFYLLARVLGHFLNLEIVPEEGREHEELVTEPIVHPDVDVDNAVLARHSNEGKKSLIDKTSRDASPLPVASDNDGEGIDVQNQVMSGQHHKKSIVLTIEADSAVIVAVVRTGVLAERSGDVEVEVNGRRVDVKISRLGGGKELVEFDGEAGGIARIVV